MLALLLGAAPSAFAATSHEGLQQQHAGALLFVGFLALVVVIQLVPAVMTLVGSLKGMAKQVRG
jgi:hypothetical protein